MTASGDGGPDTRNGLLGPGREVRVRSDWAGLHVRRDQ